MKANTYVIKPFGISEVKVIALKGDPGTPTQEQINIAVDEYMTEHPEAQIPDGSITEQKLSSDVVATLNEVDNKADKVGSYPDLIAGTADNLLSSSYQTDRTPYILRRTPFGARERGSIVGGSIVWNQRTQNGNFESTTGWVGRLSTLSASGNVLTLTPSSDGTSRGFYSNRGNDDPLIAVGHKYLLCTEVLSPVASGISLSFGGATGFASTPQAVANQWTPCATIWTSTTATIRENFYALVQASLTTSQQVKFRNHMTFDLTLMFGPTIADYIYAQEQATAGAGVALAKAWAGITADYYPYDAGSIKSVTGLTAHRMTDGNGDVIGEYPLDSSLTLRGRLKLDGDSIYYDGDIYKADGTVERRYGVRAYQSGDESDANVLTDGTNTVYKLTTPTTEQAEPYTELQICGPNGTEEWVGASMPVGHDTKYYEDLKGKIEDIPDAPSANGTYVLKATVSSSGVTYSWVAG